MKSPDKPKPSLRRRSGRILLRVPLLISATDSSGTSEWENVETIMVSFHGGMIRTHQNFEVGTTLEIRMRSKDRTAHARVVWRSAEQMPQGVEIGFEIIDEQGFWEIHFPPDSSKDPSTT